jgi:hypothetical protein
MVSTEFRHIGAVAPERHIQPSYTAFIERSPAALLLHLTRPALTVGYEN